MTEAPLSIRVPLPDSPSLCFLHLCSGSIRSAQFQPAHVPAGQAARCFLPHHTHQCVFCFLPDCLLTFLFFPIRKNGFSLIVQGSFLQPAFVTLVLQLYLSFPLFLLISGAIYTETFLLTLRAPSPLLQSASLFLFVLLALILLLFFFNNERKEQMRKNSPILKGDIHREAQHFS